MEGSGTDHSPDHHPVSTAMWHDRGRGGRAARSSAVCGSAAAKPKHVITDTAQGSSFKQSTRDVMHFPTSYLSPPLVDLCGNRVHACNCREDKYMQIKASRAIPPSSENAMVWETEGSDG